MPQTIGFIGLGRLGLPIARNLLAAGHVLKVFNRTAEKAKPLTDEGAQLVTDPPEVAEAGGIVFTVLSDDAALEAVTLQNAAFAQRLGPGGIHVSVSTISPDTARRVAAEHARHGVHYVAAPVFARPEAAAARKGTVCLSGSAEAKARVRPLLGQSVGENLFDFGEDPGAANVVKLAGNFMIGAAIESMAEAYTLAEKNGVSRESVMQLFSQTIFACPIYQNYGKMIAAGQYDQSVGFKMPLALKDMGLVLQTATASRVPMPLAQLVHGRLLSGLAKGRQEWDWTGLAGGVSDDAGL
jgi:3-hydroxyisobutyrate dehydrogenase-like beta-hydroxyacid dehydrogenase